ncbi:MAG: elongation factor G [Bacillota bacterium]
MSYETKKIRNIAVMGHSGEGKTSLCEAILYNAGEIDRMGKITDGTTCMDFEEQEIAKKMSISLSVASCEWKELRLNLIDLPGFYDFAGEIYQGMQAADGAIIVAGPTGEVTVGLEKSIERCLKAKLPMMLFINQVDKENADITGTIAALKETFGNKIAPLQLPMLEDGKMVGYISILSQRAYRFGETKRDKIDIPAEYKEAADNAYKQLIEAAAENDEGLLDKFFEGIELTNDEVIKGVRIGINEGSTVPILCGSATANKGVFNLMDQIVRVMPEPGENTHVKAIDGDGNEVPITISEDGATSVKVFKTIADPFVGKMNIVKVMTGMLKPGDSLINMTTGKTEKISAPLVMKGKKQKAIDCLCAGDIGAIAKLQNTNTGDTLASEKFGMKYPEIEFPKPMMTLAVTAKDSKQEEKVIQGLYRIAEEDVTFTIEKNAETNQTLLSGMGETHLDIICKKLQSKFKVEALLETPKISYRETIRKKIEAEGKHIKQSGGGGQYGVCKMRFEPLYEGEFEFASEVVGGAVPKQYIPAIEKGIRECLLKGIQAGCPVVNLKAVVFDGKYHDVDSSEVAFKMAASQAFKELKNASPILLEPIMTAEIIVNDEYTGGIMSDMNKRRGRILGMETNAEGRQVVTAEVPQAEMLRYATDLRQITQGRGKYTMHFERYESAPEEVTRKVVKAYEEEKEK